MPLTCFCFCIFQVIILTSAATVFSWWIAVNVFCNEPLNLRLRPSVNFINALRVAFAPVDPKSLKRHWQLDWILGATGVKAVRMCWWNWARGSISPTCLSAAFTHADPKSAKRQSCQHCLFCALYNINFVWRFWFRIKLIFTYCTATKKQH